MTGHRKNVQSKADYDEVRVWAAGCASGEEVYSLAMFFNGAIVRIQKGLTLKVFATDLDTDAVSRARGGVYSDRELA